MRVLVTGGAGFIGSHLVDALCRDGAYVHVLDDLSTGRRIPENARFTRWNVREYFTSLVKQERIEVMIHLAARVSVRTSLEDPLEDASVNVLGGLSALEAAAEAGVRRVILASSGGTVYGEGKGRPSREEDPLEPRSPYGVAKLAMESYATAYERTRGLEVSCLRLANVYGPRQDPEGESGVVARFLARLRDGRPLEVYGDGRQIRDFVFVEDVVRAFLSAIQGPPGTYNVGTGVGTSLLELIDLLGRPARVIHKPAIAGELRANILDVRRADERLGWTPKIPFAEGVARTAGRLAPR